MFSKLISVALFFMAATASAGRFETRELKSEDGVEIGVSFYVVSTTTNSNKPSSYISAEQLKFFVKHSSLRSSDKVRAVLINRESFFKGCGGSGYEGREPNYVMDLTYNSAKRMFVAEFKNARLIYNGVEVPLTPDQYALQIFHNGYCSSTNTKQELALVINGRWQTDPVNKTPNFRMSFTPFTQP